LLLRTHGFQAYQAAQYNVMDRQRDVLPYWQYLTMEDEKVRPEHAALDQIVLPASSPFWNSHYPPWDYGCRCQVVPISQDDRDELDEKDKKRAPDNQLVLEGSQAQRLEQGQLVRPGRSFDVRSPREKEGGSGYGWHPGDLRLSIDQLRGRYDTATFSAFSSWARTTPLEQGGARTVWDWLGGQSAGPVTPPRLDLASVIGAHVAHPGTMTPTEAARVVDALRQSHDVMAAAKTTIHVDPALSRGWKDYVSYEVSNFFSLLPKSLLDTLPKFDVQVVENHPEGILGSYDRANRVLVLNAKTLDGNASLIQETIFHELMHWVHRHGPAWYQQGIEQHFLDRTKGEATTQLPGYGSGTIGRKDKWWDSYMGRMYGGKTDGAEIPTMAAELLASPAKFALLWNEPLHRATIQEALSILFPRP
jgi:SPP1 gp7 family putative phage head morphogenesis protein